MLITSPHSKRYRLIHRRNLYVSRSRRCTGRREAQSRKPVNKVKIISVHKFKKTPPSMPVSEKCRSVSSYTDAAGT
jgi:hypothetical protein